MGLKPPRLTSQVTGGLLTGQKWVVAGRDGCRRIVGVYCRVEIERQRASCRKGIGESFVAPKSKGGGHCCAEKPVKCQKEREEGVVVPKGKGEWRRRGERNECYR